VAAVSALAYVRTFVRRQGWKVTVLADRPQAPLAGR
jgi:hypothetical protein